MITTTNLNAPPVTRPTPARRRAAAVATFYVPVLLLALYLGVSSYVADRLSHPERWALTSTPAEYGLAYEDVQFNSTVDNIPLSGWYIDSPGDRVIVMLHGRNGRRDGEPAMDIAARLAGHGFDVFMFDFRAHGGSGGERYSMGQWEVRDVEGALKYLESRGVTRVGLHTTSMGGAPGLSAALSHSEIEAIVTDSAFAGLSLILEKELPKASGLPEVFNPGVYLMSKLLYGVDLQANRPAETVARLGDRPLLVIHSQEDGEGEIIPVSHAYALQKAGANNPNMEVWIAPGKGHCRAFTNNKEEYSRRMLDFYDKYLK